MKKRVWIIALLICVLLLSGCGAGDYEAAKAQIRNLYGENEIITGDYDDSLAAVCNNGVFVGLNESGVISYKGIPYAEPPVGNLRWKNPVPAKDSETVYQAYYYGYSPVQTEWPSEEGSYYPQSEDCLTLNVWSNANGPSEGKTVMVFFHGGSYGWGAVSDPMYDGHNLIEKYPDVILVTVEYRLGILGFIDFSSVPGGEEYSTSGNLGLLDQVCALKWIKKNISAFGGNPDNVTIFGESAGAGSVSLIPLIKEADGLYQRVIAESGSVALTYSKEECRNLTDLLLEKSGCSAMNELTALSEEELMSLNEDLNDYNNFPERDGVVLPEDLYGAYENGESAKADMLIGSNADEVRYWIDEMGYYVSGIPGMALFKNLFPVMYENNRKLMTDEEKQSAEKFLSLQSGRKIWKLTEFYNELLFRIPAMKQAELCAENGNNVYTYYWTMPGENETIGACHAIELIYVFNNPQVTIYNGNVYNRELADTVQNMWVNFARTGDPSTETITWQAYNGQTRMTMVLGEEVRMESAIKDEQRKLIEPLLGHYFNGCYSQLDLMVPQTFRIGGLILAAILLLVTAFVCFIRILKRKSGKSEKQKNSALPD